MQPTDDVDVRRAVERSDPDQIDIRNHLAQIDLSAHPQQQVPVAVINADCDRTNGSRTPSSSSLCLLPGSLSDRLAGRYQSEYGAFRWLGKR